MKYYFIVGLRTDFLDEVRPQQPALFPSYSRSRKGETQGIWTVAMSRGEALYKVAGRLKVSVERIEGAVRYIKRIKALPSASRGSKKIRFKLKKGEWREVNMTSDGIAVYGKDRNGQPITVIFDKELKIMQPPSSLTQKELRICFKNAYLFFIQKKQRNKEGGDKK